jgi:hypothetical protein
METKFKYILGSVAGIIILSIIIALSLPKPNPTLHNRREIEKGIRKYNSELPRKIGTIGWLNAVSVEGNSIVYNMSVEGESSVDTVYENNYSDFHNLLLYSIVVMNGQREYGTLLTKCLEASEMNLKCQVTTPSSRTFEWTLSSSEMVAFVDSCKQNPTGAMYTVIDMQVKLTRQQLPAVVDSLGNLRSVSLNAISSDALSESDLLVDIRHTDKDIEVYYVASEQDELLEDWPVNDETFVRIFTSEIAKDADAKELLNILALSHSNLILNYDGRISKKHISVMIPYHIIKDYCDIPRNLLSIK